MPKSILHTAKLSEMMAYFHRNMLIHPSFDYRCPNSGVVYSTSFRFTELGNHNSDTIFEAIGNTGCYAICNDSDNWFIRVDCDTVAW